MPSRVRWRSSSYRTRRRSRTPSGNWPPIKGDPMRIDVVMPQLGESVVEGVVVKWLVKAGDAVTKDQPLVEISTDKVDAEIPSPAAGTVAEIVAKEGQVVPIKEVLARIETEKVAAAPGSPPPPKWDEENEGVPGAMTRGTGPPIPPA